MGYLGQTAQGLCEAQVGTGLSRGLGVLPAGEAQDLGWDMGGKRLRPSPGVHLDLQALTAHTCLWPSPPCTQALKCPWATDTPALRAAQSARPCWWSGGPGPSAAPRTAAQPSPSACREEAGRQRGALQGSGSLSSGPCLGLVPDMATGAGPPEARSEMVEVTGAERPILGSIKLGKKMGGEVRWSGRRGGCLKQGQGHAPQGHLQ